MILPMKMKVLAVATAGVVALAAVPAFAATTTVRVDDTVFEPKSLTVKKGTSVRFRFVGEAPHNVRRAGGKRFKAISSREDGTVTRKLRRKGTYSLLCTIHPGMEMKIRVK